MKKALEWVKKHKEAIISSTLSGLTIGAAWFADVYVKSRVPEFVRMHGLKYIIHFLQGKDAYDEIYQQIFKEEE